MIYKAKSSDPIPWELLTLADEKEKIADYLPECQLYLFEENASIVAVAALAKKATNFELMNIAVAEENQGAGIGKKLVLYLLSEIKGHAQATQQATKVIVKTGDLSRMALKLYKNCGFREIKTITNYFIDHYQEPIYEYAERLKNQVILAQTIKI